MLEEESIANWKTGRLQVFFEGSWSQVCGGAFGAPDANVACRQLGYGAGTVVPQDVTEADLTALEAIGVFPEIAISGSGCTGTEERLLDCSPELPGSISFRSDCPNSVDSGVVLGCVAAPTTGELPIEHPSPAGKAPMQSSGPLGSRSCSDITTASSTHPGHDLGQVDPGFQWRLAVVR